MLVWYDGTAADSGLLVLQERPWPMRRLMGEAGLGCQGSQSYLWSVCWGRLDPRELPFFFLDPLLFVSCSCACGGLRPVECMG